MRKLFNGIAVLAAAMLLWSGMAKSDERDELADLQARIATLEAKLMAPSGGGDAESLTSMKKKGAIKIGGTAEVSAGVASIEEAGQDDDDITDTIQEIEFSLKMRVDMSPDAYLYVKLDCEDTAADGDLVEELNYVWKNVRGSNLTVVLGKDEVFFGQDKSFLWSEGYSHGNESIISGGGLSGLADDYTMQNEVNDINSIFDGNGFLAAVAPGTPQDQNSYAASTITNHVNNLNASKVLTNDEFRNITNSENIYAGSSIMGAPWQGERDNRVQLGLQYKIGEIAKLEASIFKNSDGFIDDSDRDNFESYALRASVYPVEGLTLQASFINQHDDLMGGQNTTGAGGNAGIEIDQVNPLASLAMIREMDERVRAGAMSAQDFIYMTTVYEAEQNPNVRALSLGFDYVTPCAKWEFYAEYIHTWNAANLTDVDTDSLDIGISYAMTEKLLLAGQFGWANIDNDLFDNFNSGLDIDEDLFKLSLGAVYTTDYGVNFIFEWMHEWYENDLDGYDDTEGDAFMFSTVYNF